uniref:Uncharacterized protein n=1 Tax=Lepeophtheirus salmonis TaxID=72036 RepID=A0A0K2VF05_LEPSM
MLSVMNMLDSTLELTRPVMDTPPKESTLLPFPTVASKPLPTMLLTLTLVMLLTLPTPERLNTSHTTLLQLHTSQLPSTTQLQLHTTLPQLPTSLLPSTTLLQLPTSQLPSTTLKLHSDIIYLFMQNKSIRNLFNL